MYTLAWNKLTQLSGIFGGVSSGGQALGGKGLDKKEPAGCSASSAKVLDRECKLARASRAQHGRRGPPACAPSNHKDVADCCVVDRIISTTNSARSFRIGYDADEIPSADTGVLSPGASFLAALFARHWVVSEQLRQAVAMHAYSSDADGLSPDNPVIRELADGRAHILGWPSGVSSFLRGGRGTIYSFLKSKVVNAEKVERVTGSERRQFRFKVDYHVWNTAELLETTRIYVMRMGPGWLQTACTVQRPRIWRRAIKTSFNTWPWEWNAGKTCEDLRPGWATRNSIHEPKTRIVQKRQLVTAHPRNTTPDTAIMIDGNAV
ncbi:uncharacterized protein EI90DRAFT_3014383 [Cantharellus anzutake]|uniref:uncharacterized protein n=1 Tax=Cantharellus anzutake TaxID=1750568 RepID=UPI0019089F42|nr:uncharacterized protein EI90DRAFT_3014383 [Cantharellus anzutake]KAF8335743.1 hypothetical protein EI90DRAFT_3014383 [Cantharellus anzutake]